MSNDVMPVGTYFPSSVAAKDPPANARRGCDGRHMAAVVVELPCGSAFSAFVRPGRALEELGFIISACGASAAVICAGGEFWSYSDDGSGK